MFRTIPLALRFLRLAGGRTLEEMGRALHVGSDAVAAFERGDAIPTTLDVSNWLLSCRGDLTDLAAAVEAAEVVWPPQQVVLALPQFHGPDAPSDHDFHTAERLIHRLQEWETVTPPAGIESLAETAQTLTAFFKPWSALMSAVETAAPEKLLAVAHGKEALAPKERRWWGIGLGQWFNFALACQGPLGCRFFRLDRASTAAGGVRRVPLGTGEAS